MPLYRIGGKLVRRKNMYLPCVLSDKLGEMTDEEQAEIYKRCKWIDLLTAQQWEIILGKSILDDKHKAVVISQMKKRIIGYWLILGRIYTLNGSLFNECLEKADKEYLELIGEPLPYRHREETEKR